MLDTQSKHRIHKVFQTDHDPSQSSKPATRWLQDKLMHSAS